MSTVIELRKEKLQAELATLEHEEQRTRTLASQLNAARAAEAEASRLARVNTTEVERWTSGVEFLRTERDTTPWQFEELRAKHNKEFREAENNLFRLQADAPELATKAHEKRLERIALEGRIATHPVYKSIREQQRELVEKAAKLVESLFESTLDHWPRLLDTISKTEQAESSLILRSIPELLAAGLPEISRALNGFFQQGVPHTIYAAIPHERKRAFQEIARVRDLASRGMVR